MLEERCGNPSCNKILSHPVDVCSKCKSTPYCSRQCQVAHAKQHGAICKLLNKGKAQQLNHIGHDETDKISVADLVTALHSYSLECREIYRLFMSTTKEDDDTILNARVEQMTILAHKLSDDDKIEFLHQMVRILVRLKTWRITMPVSPVLILLECGADVNGVFPSDCTFSPLCLLAQKSSSKNQMVNKNQVIIGRQLLERGADPNFFKRDGSSKHFGNTALYNACYSLQAANLDFIELLLEFGADRNQNTNVGGSTAIMSTFDMALPVAKLLLTYEHKNCVPIDVNVPNDQGLTALDWVRLSISRNARFRDDVSVSGQKANGSSRPWAKTAPYEYILEQLRELEDILIGMGAIEGKVDPKWMKYELETTDMDVDEARGREPTEPKEPIDYDVSCLFGRDLFNDKTVPGWYDGFRISDLLALQHQAHEGKEHLHSNGGCVPKLGQKVKLIFYLPNGAAGFLVGKVVLTYPVPSDWDLECAKRSTNPSLLYENTKCHEPGCNCNLSRVEIWLKYGAVHTQEVKCIVKLAVDMEDGSDPTVTSFFGVSRKYDVILRCNDNKGGRMWGMARIDPHKSSK